MSGFFCGGLELIVRLAGEAGAWPLALQLIDDGPGAGGR